MNEMPVYGWAELGGAYALALVTETGWRGVVLRWLGK